MKKPARHEPQPPQSIGKLRYHIMGSDHLYTPIPFLFVTDRMCKEIAEERQTILAHLSDIEQARQRKLFDKYNPTHSATAFNAMLRLFSMTPKD